MLLYYIFNIITVFLALAFVLVHLVAALSAILNGKKSLGTGFILAGAIVGMVLAPKNETQEKHSC